MFELEAQAYQRKGAFHEALIVLEQALAMTLPAGGPSLIPLLLLQAQLAVALNDYGLAEASHRQAEQTARRLDRSDLILTVLTQWVELSESSHKPERAEALGAFLCAAPYEFLQRYPSLSRMAIGFAAQARPELLARGLSAIGLVTTGLSDLFESAQRRLKLRVAPLNNAGLSAEQINEILLRALESGRDSESFQELLARTFCQVGAAELAKADLAKP